MADAWVRSGVNPDSPDDVVLVVVVSPDGPPGERVLSRLGLYSYEGDRVFYFVRTDGWVERRLDGHTLTVDVVAYPAAIEQLVKGLDVDIAEFTQRSDVNPEAIRLLRVSTTVDPAEYARAGEATAIWTAAAGTTADRVVAAIHAEEDWPVICAPPPEPDEASAE